MHYLFFCLQAHFFRKKVYWTKNIQNLYLHKYKYYFVFYSRSYQLSVKVARISAGTLQILKIMISRKIILVTKSRLLHQGQAKKRITLEGSEALKEAKVVSTLIRGRPQADHLRLGLEGMFSTKYWGALSKKRNTHKA